MKAGLSGFFGGPGGVVLALACLYCVVIVVLIYLRGQIRVMNDPWLRRSRYRVDGLDIVRAVFGFFLLLIFSVLMGCWS
jgi:hypothetical protein